MADVVRSKAPAVNGKMMLMVNRLGKAVGLRLGEDLPLCRLVDDLQGQCDR